jgi:hypothetical protein
MAEVIEDRGHIDIPGCLRVFRRNILKLQYCPYQVDTDGSPMYCCDSCALFSEVVDDGNHIVYLTCSSNTVHIVKDERVEGV